MFLKKPDAKLEKGPRGFRAIALLSVFSNWYTTVLVDLLHEEKEPIEWRSLHVGAGRGVNCDYMQALVTKKKKRNAGSGRKTAGPICDHGFKQIYHVQNGESGRENSVRRGQARSSVEDSRLDRCQRARGGSSAGRDAGRSWFSLL